MCLMGDISIGFGDGSRSVKTGNTFRFSACLPRYLICKVFLMDVDVVE